MTRASVIMPKPGRPYRSTPAESLTIRVDKLDAVRWRKLLDNGTVKLTGAELFRMVLDRATKHSA